MARALQRKGKTMVDEMVTEFCHELLKRELIPAMGCTEPIAVALAAARAREELGRLPERMTVRCSGNVVKNVKGVVVPNTDGRKGIEVSAVLGAVAGRSRQELEVLSGVTQTELEQMESLRKKGICRVALLENVPGLDIIVEMEAGDERALVEIAGRHTEIVRVEHNGKEVIKKQRKFKEDTEEKYERLSLRIIYEYAVDGDLQPVRSLLKRQAEYNRAISTEGLKGDYGCGVGKTILKSCGAGVRARARAWAAAGSDARMAGCSMPVVINSGSGNQGMTASLPVLAYAQELGAGDEKVYRALALSNLLAIRLKSGIGRLSAFCGAVCAACGAGAAVTWLQGGDFEAVSRTVDNMLANVSGIVCDGAKPSCAAKIASCVDAALLSSELALKGKKFQEGIVGDCADETIENVVCLAKIGMRETDLEILRIMTRE